MTRLLAGFPLLQSPAVFPTKGQGCFKGTLDFAVCGKGANRRSRSQISLVPDASAACAVRVTVLVTALLGLAAAGRFPERWGQQGPARCASAVRTASSLGMLRCLCWVLSASWYLFAKAWVDFREYCFAAHALCGCPVLVVFLQAAVLCR